MLIKILYRSKRTWKFIVLLFLFIFFGTSSVMAQVVFIPPYARLSLSYHPGGDRQLFREDDKSGSEDISSLVARSGYISNFGMRFGYGVFVSHQSRLQAEGSVLFRSISEYEWKGSQAVGLVDKTIIFKDPRGMTNLNFVLSGYQDLERLNPYQPGSWSPYVGGGVGVYGAWHPSFSVNLAEEGEKAGDDERIVSGEVIGSDNKPTGGTRDVIISGRRDDFTLGPVGMIEVGVSYNLNNYLLEFYGRAEYMHSFTEGLDSDLLFTLNFGMRL